MLISFLKWKFRSISRHLSIVMLCLILYSFYLALKWFYNYISSLIWNLMCYSLSLPTIHALIQFFFNIMTNHFLETFIILNVFFILITRIESFIKSSSWTLQKLQKNEIFYLKNSLIIFFFVIMFSILNLQNMMSFYALDYEAGLVQIILSENFFLIDNNFIYNFSNLLYKNLLVFFFIFIFFFYKMDLLSVTRNKNMFIFFVLLNFLIFFSSFFMLCYDFFLMFILLIGLNINIYSLLIFEGKNKNIHEASIKYFLMSSLGTLFILGGISLIFLFYKTTNFFDIHNILLYNRELQNFEKLKEINSVFFFLSNVYSEINTSVRLEGENIIQGIVVLTNFFRNYNNFVIILFLLLGLTFKLALFPLHSWAVEVYSTISIRLISIFILILKLIFFIKTIQIFFFVFQSHIETIQFLKSIVLFLAISSIVFGSIAALFEEKIKKLIAYSSTNQFGFIFLAISTMLNTEQKLFFWTAIEGLQSSLLFIFIYLLSNLILFWVLFPNSNGKSIVYLKDIGNIPFLKQLQIYVILLSFSGLPPFAGFFSKFFIFFICWKEKLFLITIISVFISVFSNFYYLKLIKINLFDENYIILKKNNFHFIQQVNDYFISFLNIVVFLLNNIIVFFFFFLENILKYSLFLAINSLYFS